MEEKVERKVLMNRWKVLYRLFAGMAVLLSDCMCAVVAWDYQELKWAGQSYLTSAPPSVAFVFLIPFGFGILLCVLLAWFFRRKSARC